MATQRDLSQDRTTVPYARLERLIGPTGQGGRAVMLCEIAPWPCLPGSEAGWPLAWERAIHAHLEGVLEHDECLLRLDDRRLAIVLRGSDPERAARIGRSVLHRLRAPVQAAGSAAATMAIGAALDARGERAPCDLVRQARSALGRARRDAGEGFRLFDDAEAADAGELGAMAAALRHALRTGQLLPRYHQRLDLDAGAVTVLETLCRWEHGGQVLAGTDLAAFAERTGLGQELAAWRLEQACRQLACWRQRGLYPGALSLDLPLSSVVHAHFRSLLTEALERHQLPPARLIFQVSESEVMADQEAAVLGLHRLSDTGVRLGLHGVGLGSISLSQLRRLPVSVLKLDGSLTCGLEHSADAAAVIRALVAMAEAARMKVVAEGVDSLRLQACLAELGCAAVQGGMFGVALAAEDVPVVQPGPAWRPYC